MAAAYSLLQGSALDVLLLGLPLGDAGVRECTELLARLVGSEIDTLVIVLSSDELLHQAHRHGRSSASA